MVRRGRIPEPFINDLIARANIVEVIEEFVSLKRQGDSYKACCPFHQEKTPSFIVHPVKQFYHCFGCGVGGGVIRFLMDYRNLGFVEAIEVLADRYGMAVPRDQSSSLQAQRTMKRREELFKVQEKAALFYQNELSRSDLTRDYLRSRKIDLATSQKFMLGYAPPGRNVLLKHLAKDFDTNLLVQAGLVGIKNGACYDRFFNRLMFPIRDQRGRVVAFGGRSMEKNARAKYLNSPETPLFIKHREIYGTYEAARQKKLHEVWVVEGYMDVVSLACHGMQNCVATLGTATNAQQVVRLFKMCGRIVFCFDGDTAGRRAAVSASMTVLPLFKDGQDVRFSLLPKNKDPDDLVKEQGNSAFDSEQATPLSQFVLQNLETGLSLTSAEGCAQLVEQARKLLYPLPKTTFKDILASKIAKKAGVEVEVLATRPPRISLAPAPVQTAILDHKYNPVRLAIRFLLDNPLQTTCAIEPGVIKETGVRGSQLLAEIISTIKNHRPVNAGAVLEMLCDNKHYHRLTALLEEDPPGENEFRDAMETLKNYAGKARSDLLIKKAEKEALSDEEKKELQKLMKETRHKPNTDATYSNNSMD